MKAFEPMKVLIHKIPQGSTPALPKFAWDHHLVKIQDLYDIKGSRLLPFLLKQKNQQISNSMDCQEFDQVLCQII